MSALTDGDIDAILKDSRRCVAPGMGDVQRMVAQIRQLKAENAGLQTGYKAYEHVNAELRAEVEALRKVVATAASRMTDAKTCFERDFPGEWSGELHLAVGIKEVDAALGQGEQS